jgi:hypothetical protein
MTVSGFGDTASFDAFAAGVLRRDKAQVAHQLIWVYSKRFRSPDFGQHRYRHDQRDTAGSLQGRNDRSQPPVLAPIA